jgi:thiol-disulfide isomerase/thioredoxin
MKRSIFIIVILCIYTAGHSEGIRFFKGTYAEAQGEAKKDHKLIFIDCFTTWCGPCNRMARDVFPRKDVGDFYNEHFVCVKLDMEKGEGIDIAKSYEIKSFPTYLYLNEMGELSHRTVGSREPEIFIGDGRTAIDPNQNLRGLATRFVNGDRDTVMLHKLITVTADVEPELHENALKSYWNEVSSFRILEQTNWEIFKAYEKDINSKAVQYVLEYKKDFDARYGKTEVDKVLCSKAAEAIKIAADKKDQNLFQSARNILAGCTEDKINEAAGLNTLRFYRKTGEWQQYQMFADPFLKQYGKSQEIYNSVAWEMVANSDDAGVLSKALEYADASVKLDKNYGNTDTRANILYKLKKYKEARIAARESIELAKKEKLDYTSTKELLDKIEKSLNEQKTGNN